MGVEGGVVWGHPLGQLGPVSAFYGEQSAWVGDYVMGQDLLGDFCVSSIWKKL